MFLQHLSPLLSLTTFAALWLTILDFMDKYMHAGSSDLLVRCWIQSFGQPFITLQPSKLERCFDLVWVFEVFKFYSFPNHFVSWFLALATVFKAGHQLF